MSRLSPRLPLAPPRVKPRPRIRILRKLAPDPFERPAPALSEIFSHALQQGEPRFIPHSLAEQQQRSEHVPQKQGLVSAFLRRQA